MTDISFPVRVIATGPDSYWTQDAAGTVRRYDLRGELFATVPAGPACDRIVAQLAEQFPAQASTTPVADALQLADQAGTEYGVPSAELLALRKLAGAVRSHGIGADLGARRLPALECAWCGKPATLDGCTVCDSTGIRKVPGQPAEPAGIAHAVTSRADEPLPGGPLPDELRVNGTAYVRAPF